RFAHFCDSGPEDWKGAICHSLSRGPSQPSPAWLECHVPCSRNASQPWRWRMHLASSWLSRDRLTVREVATRLGYESEASFSRAFKRFMHVPPSAIRRGSRNERATSSPQRQVKVPLGRRLWKLDRRHSEPTGNRIRRHLPGAYRRVPIGIHGLSA